MNFSSTQAEEFITDIQSESDISVTSSIIQHHTPSPELPNFPINLFPQVNPRMNQNNHNYVSSVLTMPIPGARLAPEKFRGEFHKVKEFILHYERLCVQNNVSVDSEKCETLLRYCSKREKHTIMNIPSYVSQNWTQLRTDILKLYDADLDNKRYKVKDIRNFSKKHKKKHIHDLAGWRKYCRAFLRVAGSLLTGEKITDNEYAAYFWHGVPRLLRARIENRILVHDPVRDLSVPFSTQEIDTAAEAILQRDRFDRVLADTDTEEEEETSGEESDSESEDETTESESEDDRRARKRKFRKRGKKYTKKREDVSKVKKEKVDRIRGVVDSRKEVEGLIRQMNMLTTSDPEYRVAYYKAMKLDPDVRKVVYEPETQPTYRGYPRADLQQLSSKQQNLFLRAQNIQ